MLQKINPTKLDSWKALEKHFDETKAQQMRTLFNDNSNRFKELSIQFEDILIDYSKNRLTSESINLLMTLAKECGITEAIDSMFSGQKINETENRAVLHVALRNQGATNFYFENENISEKISTVLNQMEDFSTQFTEEKLKGFDGQTIDTIVNIGIGGSDLGPVMVTEALKAYQKNIEIFFVSNIDGAHLTETLKKVEAGRVLFIIASKTFTTQETMTNAYSAKKWLLDNGATENDIKKHFIALSTNKTGVEKFGIDPKNMFAFWDWVGGRYSLTSAIGLPIACAIGFDHFKALLEGASAMDQHFRSSKLEENIPLILALIGIWYNNFYGCETEAILPYNQYLHRFPAYFQQANMESNGKSVDRNGDKIAYQTGPIIWGEPGTNGQHAFYQLIHQGTKIIPCDFLAAAQSQTDLGDHQEKLLANFFAQTEALMNGKTLDEVKKELAHLSADELKKAAPFRVFEGNRPTNSILFKKLTPRTLGSLIAMYEHKIFCQGVIWNVFSFDQWGVQLGKLLANNILPELSTSEKISKHDSSTNGLINWYKANK